MIIKRIAFFSALMSLIVGSSHAQTLHGSLSGMSGAGYVTGNYSEGVLLNPSLGAAYNPDKDSFALLLSAGALLSDKDDLIDKADELVDLTDVIRNSQVMSAQQGYELLDRLEAIDGNIASVSVGANVVISIPNEYMSLAFIVNARGNVMITPDIAESDLALIPDAIGGVFDPESSLESMVIGRGAVLTEVGVSLSKAFTLENGNILLLGTTPKAMEVKSILYNENIANFDEDDFDADQYTVTDDAFGIDIGATYIIENIRYGAVITNVNGNDFQTIVPGQVISTKPQLTTSIGYIKDNLKTELAVDMNAAPLIGYVDNSQFVRAGAEYTAWKWLHFRAGIARDTKGVAEDTYSLGFGIGALNIAYIKGSNQTEGVALSGGIRF